MLDMDKEMLELFFEDTTEMLDSCIDKLLDIEGEFDDEIMDEIMRTMHSIKGASSMIDLYEMENFSHKLEDMFINIKNKSLCIENELMDITIESLNMLKKKLDVRKTMFLQNYLEFNKELNEEKTDFRNIIAKIERIISNEDTNETKNEGKNVCVPFIMKEEVKKIGKNKKIYKIKVLFDDTADMFELKRIMIKNNLEEAGEILDSEPEEEKILDSQDSIYDIVFVSNEKLEKILDIFDVGDIYFVCIKEAEDEKIDKSIKDSEIYIKKDMKYLTVRYFYEKFKETFKEERPKKIVIGEKKTDIYGTQMIKMLEKEKVEII